MLLIFLLPTLLSAQIRIASYDSQFQTDHFALNNKMCNNTDEIIDGIDNDENGLVDDLYGWNFSDNNNILYEEESNVYPDEKNIILYSELKMRQRAGLITPYELDWMRANAPKYESKWRGYIGFSHGTSSATTILKDTYNVCILGLRIFSKDELIPSTREEPPPPNTRGTATEEEIHKFKVEFASEVYKTFQDGVEYAASVGVRAFSFGVLWQLDENDGASLKEKLARRYGLFISDARAEKLAREFFETLLEMGNKLFTSHPNILFFMAAGNSGINNDSTLSFPHDIPGDNAIVAGASDFYGNLAAFSSYGKESVDVLIPTINIVEWVPNDLTMVSSATSVSVVLVANVAARVLEINSALTASQVRRLLYGTADRKEHLTNIIKTGSIINKERAVEAAQLSRFMRVDEAVARSFAIVP